MASGLSYPSYIPNISYARSNLAELMPNMFARKRATKADFGRLQSPLVKSPLVKLPLVNWPLVISPLVKPPLI